MTIIEMAKECEFEGFATTIICELHQLEKFAELIRADERAKFGEPVAWILVTGHGTSLQLNKPDCELDYWKPLYTLKD